MAMVPPYLLEAVLAGPDSVEDLAVNELSADRVLPGVVPGGKELLPEVEAPGRLALTLTPLPGQLLALANGVHHMVTSTAQGPELRPEQGQQGLGLLCAGPMGMPTLLRVSPYRVTAGFSL